MVKRTLIINKYKLYIVVLAIVILFLTGKSIFYLIFFERAEGRISGEYSQLVQRKIGKVNLKYPRVVFQADGETVEFSLPSYMYEMARSGKKVTVVYNKNNPEDAYVISFYGLFGNAAAILIPFFLIWTICIFSVGFIPKKIVVY